MEGKKTLGFEGDTLPSSSFKLNKTIYGLKQALRAWYEKLSSFLLKNGFERGKMNTTLFGKKIQYIGTSICR